jgi:ribosomal protein S13
MSPRRTTATARRILLAAGVNPDQRIKDLTDAEIVELATYLSSM